MPSHAPLQIGEPIQRVVQQSPLSFYRVNLKPRMIEKDDQGAGRRRSMISSAAQSVARSRQRANASPKVRRYSHIQIPRVKHNTRLFPSKTKLPRPIRRQTSIRSPSRPSGGLRQEQSEHFLRHFRYAQQCRFTNFRELFLSILWFSRPGSNWSALEGAVIRNTNGAAQP